MERYIVLAGEKYYPRGWDDFQGSFSTLEEASAFGRGYIRSTCLKWYEVVDTKHEEVVENGSSDA